MDDFDRPNCPECLEPMEPRMHWWFCAPCHVYVEPDGVTRWKPSP